ncbi:MAG TPA: bifunctional phosphoribosylaminoimidazolecarboxamide formyltransferase/IMP cyclohydrolase [Thermoplasmata archaeon]|nr:bifunctional phosphoribosylaminoimidazolecarboxamide formyltransferase/IMP cyclohydrolase [Thermoplasmata archaeon]
MPIRRALLSVSDVTGLVELAKVLAEFGVELVATGGTARALAAAGVAVRPAEDLTGIGAWFGGRIKTLHPGLLGGILYPRTPEGETERAHRNLLPIDLVVVNLYPFEQRRREQPEAQDLPELIDVGGVTLLRAAAKNHAWVAAVVDPSQYVQVVEELRRNSGALSAATRRALARRAFERSRDYDREIVEALSVQPEGGPGFPRNLDFERVEVPLRYGENPHQPAAVYRLVGAGPMVPAPFELLQGEALSYSNLLDVDAATSVVAEFSAPTAAVAKHASPCGVASGVDISEALARALATDPVARYGCVVALNRPMSLEAVRQLSGVFVDALSAPAFESDVRTALERRKKLKLVRAAPPPMGEPRWEARTALGRLLVQESDRRQLTDEEFRPVTTHRGSPEDRASLDFAWRVVRHAKSNAIVLAQGAQTVGIGSGQPSRVRAVQIATDVAGPRASGSVLASDAFFPFADGVEVAARAGVRAILQPGGSIRDPEIIETAEKLGVAMYLTGWRVFRH